MAWTTPRTWVALEVPTAAIFNTHVRDNLKMLYHEALNQDFTSSIGGGATWTSSAYTYSGAPIILEFAIPFGVGPNTPSGSVATTWQKDGTDYLWAVDPWNNAIASSDMLGIFFRYRIPAPSSGSHTYGLHIQGSHAFYASATNPASLTIWERGG